MICPNCKNEINEGTRFCMFCGTPVMTPPDEEKTMISVAGKTRQLNAPQGQAPYQQPYQHFNPGSLQNGQKRTDFGNAEKAAGSGKKKSNAALILSIILAILLIVILVLIMFMTGILDGLKGRIEGKNKTRTESAETLDEDEENAEKEKEDSDGRTESTLSEDPQAETAASANAMPGADSPESEQPKAAKPEEVLPETTQLITLPFGTYPMETKMLELSGVQVDSLEGIEQLTELETIIIKEGSLSDVSPLAALTNLKTIVLNNVPVTDILPLIGLTNLETLNIRDTQINSENAGAFLLQTASPDLTLESYTEVRYEIMVKPLSWTEANMEATEKGGHLAVINSEEEFTEVTGMLNESGLIYVWLGAWYENGAWHTVTGEPFEYANWYPGEPSGQDNDGTVEDKLCVWYLDGSWTENDQREDLNTFLGSGDRYLGYLVEYELPTGIAPKTN